MLTIPGPRQGGYCDGLTRRNFIQVGSLGLAGLSLPQLLRAEQAAGAGRGGRGRSGKSVIMIYLPGGPPHQDLFDLKMEAPAEIRGEFRPIRTNVPGVQICEHLPRLARIMDKLVVVRSVVGAKDRHESYQCMTGRLRDGSPPGGWPEIGSVIAKLDRERRREGLEGEGTAAGPAPVPPYLNLSPKMQHRPYNFGGPSFLGAAHTPFCPRGETQADMVLQGVDGARLAGRQSLLERFDRFRRDVDASGMMEGLDAFQGQAFDVLTSARLAGALDLEREPAGMRERYGKGTAKHQGDAAPRLMEQFLLARRLVEAGARFVTVSFSFWDWHGSNFRRARENFPDLDQGVSALVEDLHARGMDEDTTVIVWGEFGRTPKINKDGGRDHWPRVSCALLAGGGMKTGQAIGATDRLGGEAAERPVTFQEIHATLYHNLGIDAAHTTVDDLSGRPRYLVDGARPLPEVI